MAEKSKIEWTDHTFNPWVGCTKVSPACDHCYAEGWAKRTGQPGLWQGERRRTRPVYWKEPYKWNAGHEAFYAEYGRRQRVFCASLADVFDNQVPEEWRNDLWQLIRETPNLDWMLLTKRPQNIQRMASTLWEIKWKNTWIGVTAENQEQFDRRWPCIALIPAAVRFISAEPLLGPLDVIKSIGLTPLGSRTSVILPKPDLIIAGGESGPKARPSHPDWFRSLRDQCTTAGLAYFHKQNGEYALGRRIQEIELPVYMGEARDGIITLTTIDPPKDAGKKTYVAVEADGRAYEMVRVGKTAAGRLLDGRTWDDFPNTRYGRSYKNG